MNPIRQCVGCRKRYPQAELVRFVRSPAGWQADRGVARLKQPGRGAYVCSDACGAAVAKNKRYPGLAAAAAECGLIRSSSDGQSCNDDRQRRQPCALKR